MQLLVESEGPFNMTGLGQFALDVKHCEGKLSLHRLLLLASGWCYFLHLHVGHV